VLQPLDSSFVVTPRPLRRRERDVGQVHPGDALPVDGLDEGLDGLRCRLQVGGLSIEQLGERRVVPLAQPVPVVDAFVAVGGQDDRTALCGRRREPAGHGDELATSGRARTVPAVLFAARGRWAERRGVVTMCVGETPLERNA